MIKSELTTEFLERFRNLPDRVKQAASQVAGINEVRIMWKDLIVEEIRQYRDEYARKFNYDLHEICQDIRKKQGQDGRRVISLSPRPAKTTPKVA